MQPMARAITVTSAPTTSHGFAILVMCRMFITRNAFDAYLIISAFVTVVRTIGVFKR